MISFSNGKYFAGGMKIAPKATLSDGLLDMVVVQKRSTIKLLYHFPKLFWGGHLKKNFIQYFQNKEIQVCGPKKRTVYSEMDGEFLGPLPLKITCLKNALPVLIPCEQ